MAIINTVDSNVLWQQIVLNATGVIVALTTLIKLFKTDTKVGEVGTKVGEVNTKTDDIKVMADGNLSALRADLKTAMERIVSLERLIAAASLPPGAQWTSRPAQAIVDPEPTSVTDIDVEAALSKMRKDHQ